jgi:hypothetical protein
MEALLSMHINKNSTFGSGSPKLLSEGRVCQGVERDVGVTPFLLFGIVTSFRTRSTLSNVRPHCSLGLKPVCQCNLWTVLEHFIWQPEMPMITIRSDVPVVSRML